MFEDLFENYVIDEKRALNFGFQQEGNSFTFRQFILQESFILEVFFQGRDFHFVVRDRDSGLDYVLVKNESVSGEFVGQVRIACHDALIHIRSQCFEVKNNLSPQTERIILHIKKTYNVSLEYLWSHSPTSAVLRHENSKKWFGVLAVLDWSKLDSKRAGKVEVLTVKHDKVGNMLAKKEIFPAYHMNKQYWISLPLDDSLSDDIILSCINISWILTS
ncbi:hypothetical protein STRDD10_00026 [Streptococcus sp. DD10]|uniref:MmcQ/YjbR family DNA-binding protein n=1 Tax=Streptococcus sp. DD10 TaxID=1777878 RepID=UPI00079725E0|nr:MmcQ/YjbR family DNA-binding protein [Streptococcus sp. DD10]KXT77362.1 hypothetical protein STRDD10_00026 [Streptococcus sp. DD10]